MPARRKATFRNRLLGSLAPQELRRIDGALARVDLDFRKILFDVGAPIRFVSFVETGFDRLLDGGSESETIRRRTSEGRKSTTRAPRKAV